MKRLSNYITTYAAVLCLFLCLIVLSACGKEKSVYVEGAAGLRCDGVYRMLNDEDDTPSYLRFFTDGSVTRCNNITNLQPEVAYKKMISADGDINNYGNVYRCTSFTINSGISVLKAEEGTDKVEKMPDVTFVFEVQGGRITYDATIGENTLSTSAFSSISGKYFDEVYEFIPIKH